MLKRNNQNKGIRDEFSFMLNGKSDTTSYYTLKGLVFTNEASYMEKELERAAGPGCSRIVINMALVRAFSSAGIRVILICYKRMKSLGGTLQIENPSENVRNVLGMTALDELLLK